MPVVRQKAEEASEIQAGPPLNGSTLQHTLDLFHKHNELCSERRKNGVNYEIRVEFERTKWLKRKYMDNLRQQQALTGRLDGPRAQLNSSSDSADGSMDTFNLKQSPGLPGTPPSEKHQPGFALQKDILTPNDKSIRSNGHSGSEEGSPSRGELTRYSKVNGHQSTMDSTFATVAIKTEPNSAENTPTCLKSPPQPVAMAGANGNGSRALNRKTPPGSISLPGGSSSCTNTPEPKRRKVLQSPRTRRPLSLRARSISSPDDPEDDLALSPGRFIHGELSTPPIKPLEEGDDPPITPSPPTSVRLIKSGEPTSSLSSALTPSTSTVITGQSTRTQESVVSVTPATSISRGGPAPAIPSAVAVRTANSNLSKDLHDFDQIMYQFTWEQSAKERRDSFSTSQSATGVVMSHMQVQPQPPTGHVISPPPYFTAATSQAIRLRTPSSPHQYYHRPQSHILHGRPPVETDPYLQMQFASPTHLPSSPHLPMHTQVVPTTSFSHPLHPQSPALMQQPQRPPDLTFQQRSMFSTQPPLLSPTVRAPISTHIPHTFPPNQGHITSATAPNGTMTSPNHPPQTPSTPLEHFNSFPPPPTCPTASQFPLPPPPPAFQSSLPSSTLTSGYQYTASTTDPQGHTVLQSPTVSVSGMHWDGQHTTPVHPQGQQQLGGSSLRQALLSQVNSCVEALSGQKVPGGVPDQAVTGLEYTSPKVTHSGMLFHMGSDLLLRRGVTGLTQPVAPQPVHFPVSFTGANAPSLPQPHTISYQRSFSHPH